MNDREFEDKMRKLTAGWMRHERATTSRTDILAEAHRARLEIDPRAPLRLLSLLAFTWVLIAALHFTTPDGDSSPDAPHEGPDVAAADATPLRAFLILQSHSELLDFP